MTERPPDISEEGDSLTLADVADEIVIGHDNGSPVLWRKVFDGEVIDAYHATPLGRFEIDHQEVFRISRFDPIVNSEDRKNIVRKPTVKILGLCRFTYCEISDKEYPNAMSAFVAILEFFEERGVHQECQNISKQIKASID